MQVEVVEVMDGVSQLTESVEQTGGRKHDLSFGGRVPTDGHRDLLFEDHAGDLDSQILGQLHRSSLSGDLHGRDRMVWRRGGLGG